MRPANERWRYSVTPSLIGWAHTQDDPWFWTAKYGIKCFSWSLADMKPFGSCVQTRVHVNLTWWRHQMETFSALLDLCAGNSLVTSEFPSQKPVKWSFDVCFDLRLNKRLSEQSWRWWFETPSCSLWRHRNVEVWLCFIIEYKLPCSHINVTVLNYSNILRCWSILQCRLKKMAYNLQVTFLNIFSEDHVILISLT